LGDILIESSQLEKAREAFQKSADYYSEIILQCPDKALYYRDLAVSHNNIGWIFEKQGNLDTAQKGYMAAIEPAKKAAEIDPGKWEKLYEDIQRKISHSAN
jgi:tetratricopeptide (TPR) repeat protein